MPDQVVPITGLADTGVILDTPPVSLPPNAFTNAKNVRFKDGAVRKMEGEVDIFEGMRGFLEQSTVGQLQYVAWWPSPNQTTRDAGYYVFVIENTTDTANVVHDIYAMLPDARFNPVAPTSLAGHYHRIGTNFNRQGKWQHTLFNGGFTFIINNGVQSPQYITEPSTLMPDVTSLALNDLPGWDSYNVDEVIISDTYNQATHTNNPEFATGISRPAGITEYVVIRERDGVATDLDEALDFSIETTDPSSDVINLTSAVTNGVLVDGDIISIRYQSTNPVVVRAAIVRAFGDFLVAGNLVELDSMDENRIIRRMTGVVRTSNVAQPGSIPNDWNPFATGVSTADEFVIADTGTVQDMVPLQGNMYLYTNTSISVLRLTGNPSVPLTVQPVTDQYGALTTDAVLEYDGKHFVIGSDDIYLFGGHPGSIQSISDQKVRRTFFTRVNPINENTRNLFTLRYAARDEIWICYPTVNSIRGECDEAYIWNYRSNTWTIRTLNSVIFGDIAPVPGGGIPSAVLEFTGESGSDGVSQLGANEVQTLEIGSTASVGHAADAQPEIVDFSVAPTIPRLQADAAESFDLALDPDDTTGFFAGPQRDFETYTIEFPAETFTFHQNSTADGARFNINETTAGNTSMSTIEAEDLFIGRPIFSANGMGTNQGEPVAVGDTGINIVVTESGGGGEPLTGNQSTTTTNTFNGVTAAATPFSINQGNAARQITIADATIPETTSSTSFSGTFTDGRQSNARTTSNIQRNARFSGSFTVAEVESMFGLTMQELRALSATELRNIMPSSGPTIYFDGVGNFQTPLEPSGWQINGFDSEKKTPGSRGPGRFSGAPTNAFQTWVWNGQYHNNGTRITGVLIYIALFDDSDPRNAGNTGMNWSVRGAGNTQVFNTNQEGESTLRSSPDADTSYTHVPVGINIVASGNRQTTVPAQPRTRFTNNGPGTISNFTSGGSNQGSLALNASTIVAQGGLTTWSGTVTGLRFSNTNTSTSTLTLTHDQADGTGTTTTSVSENSNVVVRNNSGNWSYTGDRERNNVAINQGSTGYNNVSVANDTPFNFSAGTGSNGAQTVTPTQSIGNGSYGNVTATVTAGTRQPADVQDSAPISTGSGQNLTRIFDGNTSGQLVPIYITEEVPGPYHSGGATSGGTRLPAFHAALLAFYNDIASGDDFRSGVSDLSFVVSGLPGQSGTQTLTFDNRNQGLSTDANDLQWQFRSGRTFRIRMRVNNSNRPQINFSATWIVTAGTDERDNSRNLSISNFFFPGVTTTVTPDPVATRSISGTNNTFYPITVNAAGTTTTAQPGANFSIATRDSTVNGYTISGTGTPRIFTNNNDFDILNFNGGGNGVAGSTGTTLEEGRSVTRNVNNDNWTGVDNRQSQQSTTVQAINSGLEDAVEVAFNAGVAGVPASSSTTDPVLSVNEVQSYTFPGIVGSNVIWNIAGEIDRLNQEDNGAEISYTRFVERAASYINDNADILPDWTASATGNTLTVVSDLTGIRSLEGSLSEFDLMNNPTAQTLTVTNTVDGFADVGSTPLPIEYIFRLPNEDGTSDILNIPIDIPENYGTDESLAENDIYNTLNGNTDFTDLFTISKLDTNGNPISDQTSTTFDELRVTARARAGESNPQTGTTFPQHGSITIDVLNQEFGGRGVIASSIIPVSRGTQSVLPITVRTHRNSIMSGTEMSTAVIDEATIMLTGSYADGATTANGLRNQVRVALRNDPEFMSLWTIEPSDDNETSTPIRYTGNINEPRRVEVIVPTHDSGIQADNFSFARHQRGIGPGVMYPSIQLNFGPDSQVIELDPGLLTPDPMRRLNNVEIAEIIRSQFEPMDFTTDGTWIIQDSGPTMNYGTAVTGNQIKFVNTTQEAHAEDRVWTISDVLYGDTNATFSTNQNDPDLGYLDSDTSTWVTRATGDFNLDFRGVQEKRATPTKIIVEISNPDAMNLLGQPIQYIPVTIGDNSTYDPTDHTGVNGTPVDSMGVVNAVQSAIITNNRRVQTNISGSTLTIIPTQFSGLANFVLNFVVNDIVGEVSTEEARGSGVMEYNDIVMNRMSDQEIMQFFSGDRDSAMIEIANSAGGATGTGGVASNAVARSGPLDTQDNANTTRRPDRFDDNFTPATLAITRNINEAFDPLRPWPTSQVNLNREFPVFVTSILDNLTGDLTQHFRGADLGFLFLDETYESFVERIELALTPEFDTEQLQSIALWADGGTPESFGGMLVQALLDIKAYGTNNPGQTQGLFDVNLVPDGLPNSFQIGQDYKIDMRIHGRFINLRISDMQNQEVAWAVSGIQADIKKGGTR